MRNLGNLAAAALFKCIDLYDIIMIAVVKINSSVNK